MKRIRSESNETKNSSVGFQYDDRGSMRGLAESLGMDASFIRIAAVLLFIMFHAVMLLVYIILWAILPRGIR